MKASLKKIKDCRVRLVVEVGPELIEKKYQAVLRDIQRVAQLPGFRPGKAPLEMVEKKFAKEAEEETLKALIPEAYHQSILAEEIRPVTMPSISDVEFQRGKKLSFAAEFERVPEFSLKSYKGIKLCRPSIEVGDKDLKMGLESLLESRAELVPVAAPRAAQKGDFITADVEIWSEDRYIPGKQGVLLFVEPSEHDDFFDKIMGAQENDVREISHKPTAEEVSKGVEAKPHYRVTVRGLKEKKLPELNDEFAKSFGKETVDELQEAVRKDMARHKQTQSMEQMKKELYEKLLEQHHFVVPEELCVKQKERLRATTRRELVRAGVAESRLEEDLQRFEGEISKRAEEQVRAYFILQEIAEKENIDVDEAELEARLRALVQESGRPMEEVKRMFEDDLRENLCEAKTIEFLVANAKFSNEGGSASGGDENKPLAA